MTNELEKKFFDTFGIEKKQRKACVDENILCPTPKKECEECFYFQYIHEYPQITDRILLGIIAKIMWSYSCTQNDFNAYEVSTVDNLKEAVLKHAIELSKNDDYVFCGVRTLFEEG